jgi:acyl dehydratase
MCYFEDFQVGQVHELGAYEVTREEILAFARQYDPQPFHLDG